MVAEYVASSSGTSGTFTATEFDVALPTGWAPGDTVILTEHHGGNSLTASISSGWEVIPGPSWPVTQGTNSRAYGWYRVMQTGDTGPTITLSGSATGGYVATLVTGSTLSPIGQVSTATASATSVGIGTLTGVLADSLVVAHAHARVPTGTTNPTGLTPDADYTERVDTGTSRNTATNQNVRIASSTRAVSSAGNLSGDTVSVTDAISSSLFVLAVEVLAAQDAVAVQAAPRVDLFLGGHWTDITGDTDLGNSRSEQNTSRIRHEITMGRGRRSGQAQSELGTCEFTLSDRDGKYNRRNPRSPLIGKLSKNMPVRISREILSAEWETSSSSGWPNADTGQSFTSSGGDANDYAAGSGEATIVVDTVNSLRNVYTADISRKNVSVVTTVTPGAVASSSSFQIGIEVRRLSGDTNYRGYLSLQPSGVAELVIIKEVSTSVTTLDSVVANFTYDANTTIGMELVAYANVLEFYAWDVDAASEEASFVSVTDSDITDRGAVGITAAIGTGETAPKTFTFGPLYVLDVRFVGEIPDFPHRWHASGKDVTVRVPATGIMRRLGQGSGSRALKSAVRRYLDRLVPGTDDIPVAYWPLDEGPSATFARPVYGRYDMVHLPNATYPGGGTIRTQVKYGAGDLGGWLEKGAQLEGGAQYATLWGAVRMGANLAGSWTYEFAYAADASANTLIAEINPTYLGGDETNYPRVTVNASAETVALSLNGSTSTSAAIPRLFDGLGHWIRFVTTIDGADTDFVVSVDGTPILSGTRAGYQVPHVQWAAITVAIGTGSPPSFSHVLVWDVDPTTDVIDAGRGWTGEPAAERIERLGREEGVAVAVVGDPSTTSSAGPQRLASLLTLMRDAETVDQGLLGEARGLLGILYRTRSSLENPVSTLELNYADGHLSGAPEPSDDDLTIANTVTVSDVLGGSSYSYTRTDGSLGTDAMGESSVSVSASVARASQLDKLAGWIAHLGTWDEEFWPRIPVNMMRSQITASQILTDGIAELDLGDAFTIADIPDWLPAEDPFLMVVGNTERLSIREWEISLDAEPCRPYNVAEYGHATLGIVGSAGSTLAADFEAGTDTSLSVAVAQSHPLWITGTVDFDVIAGGIILHATSIAGATSPQTITVDATPVNGVTNTIPAGTPVTVYPVAVYGLGR